jgi:RNA polymerase sigma factor (sigma-70 family)
MRSLLRGKDPLPQTDLHQQRMVIAVLPRVRIVAQLLAAPGSAAASTRCPLRITASLNSACSAAQMPCDGDRASGATRRLSEGSGRMAVIGATVAFGGLAAWRLGGLAAWRLGGLAAWRLGGGSGATFRGWRTKTVRGATYWQMQSDEELIAAVARTEQDALRALYDRHATAMLRLIRRLTSNTSIAEEILQEAWLAVWQSAGAFRGDSSVRGWVLGVARRQAHNRLRKAQPQLVDIDEMDASAAVDARVDVEAHAIMSIAHDKIIAAIVALPDHLREVAVLALVEDLPYQDIATVVGVPLGTVKSRMSHVRTRLMSALIHQGVRP